jgi:hypothetical protein
VPDRVALPDARGQIAPRRGRSGDPEDVIQDQPTIVARWEAGGAPAGRRKKRREQRPRRVVDEILVQDLFPIFSLETRSPHNLSLLRPRGTASSLQKYVPPLQIYWEM